MNFTIRRATIDDSADILLLIKELALFEKAPGEVTNTIERIKNDGFGDSSIFDAFVAMVDQRMVGLALTYYRYSTWKGKCLYLEDLIVTEEFRGQGIGKQLFETCVNFGKEMGCVQMNWQVLDWNTPAIEFYKAYHSSFDSEWVNCSIKLND